MFPFIRSMLPLFLRPKWQLAHDVADRVAKAMGLQSSANVQLVIGMMAGEQVIDFRVIGGEWEIREKTS